MDKTKHEAVWEWLLGCPYIKDLYFNFSQSNNGDTMLAPLTAYNDTVILEFITGLSIRQYDFAIVRFEALTTEPNNEQNIEILIDVEAIATWVEAQIAANNFPEFPTGCKIQSIEALPSNVGYVAATNQNAAKYMLQFRIEYMKEA